MLLCNRIHIYWSEAEPAGWFVRVHGLDAPPLRDQPLDSSDPQESARGLVDQAEHELTHCNVTVPAEATIIFSHQDGVQRKAEAVLFGFHPLADYLSDDVPAPRRFGWWL